ncbi:MAG TPA: CHAP domain-containing protein [Candidatus Saccharimonadales bacterium]
MQKPKIAKSLIVPMRALALTAIIAVVVGGAANVHADQFDDQINALRDQNAQTQGVLNGLTSQASSYQDTLNQLQTQINTVQAQINTNVASQNALQQQITDAQNKITEQKKYLGEDIKAMYVDGQLSTIEELATSKSLSDYVDKEEYRTSVQNKINDLIKQIAALQAQLQKQKSQLDQLVESEKQQNQQLASAQAAQQSLLSYNQSQQAAYNSQISANSSKIADLRKQQAILNARYNIGDFKGDPNNGGYPSAWANAPQDSLIDSWGMYNRECVSYTAFRVHQDYIAGKNSRDMPYWGGVGNANQWDDNARNAGIPVDGNPTPGSIAISNAGAYGHAMYVEAVNGNQIYVQQYNASLNGTYSEGWRYTTGLVFIHF